MFKEMCRKIISLVCIFSSVPGLAQGQVPPSRLAGLSAKHILATSFCCLGPEGQASIYIQVSKFLGFAQQINHTYSRG